jgi:FHS family glucose/mannose:H+ symporter-like MFS transporter
VGPGQKRTSPTRALAPIFLYFFVAGIVTVMLGPLLPALSLQWKIQDAQAGTLFTANFLGQLCGSWVAARNLRASLIFGSILPAVGCVALSWVSFDAAHLALFCIGLGLGAGLTAGNIIAGTAFPASRARLLAILNVAWGLGAIACPLLIHVTAAGGMRRFFLTAAFLLLVSSLFPLTTATPVAADFREIELHPAAHSPSASPRMPLPPWPLVVFATAMFLYVGIENALGGWLPTYAIRVDSSLHASSFAIYFWVAELSGRLLVAVVMTFLGEAALYRLCIGLLILTEALLCFIVHIAGASVIALTILGGFTLAPVYPLLVSFMLARTGNHKRLGILFASGSIGGAVLPWLTGVFSTRFDSLRFGLLVPAVGAITLFFLSPIVTSKSASPMQTSS